MQWFVSHLTFLSTFAPLQFCRPEPIIHEYASSSEILKAESKKHKPPWEDNLAFAGYRLASKAIESVSRQHHKFRENTQPQPSLYLFHQPGIWNVDKRVPYHSTRTQGQWILLKLELMRVTRTWAPLLPVMLNQRCDTSCASFHGVKPQLSLPSRPFWSGMQSTARIKINTINKPMNYSYRAIHIKQNKMQQKEILEEKDISVQGKRLFHIKWRKTWTSEENCVSSPRCSTTELEGRFTTPC